MFHYLPDSAWGDGNLAEEAGQLGMMVEHRNQSQPNYPTQVSSHLGHPVLYSRINFTISYYHCISIAGSTARALRRRLPRSGRRRRRSSSAPWSAPRSPTSSPSATRSQRSGRRRGSRPSGKEDYYRVTHQVVTKVSRY